MRTLFLTAVIFSLLTASTLFSADFIKKPVTWLWAGDNKGEKVFLTKDMSFDFGNKIVEFSEGTEATIIGTEDVDPIMGEDASDSPESHGYLIWVRFGGGILGGGTKVYFDAGSGYSDMKKEIKELEYRVPVIER